jgi:hypothetical protein
MMTVVGGSSTSLSGTLSASLSAGGITIPFMRSDSFGSAVTGFGDLHRRHSGRRLRRNPAEQHRHRACRVRRRRRLHLLQPPNG